MFHDVKEAIHECENVEKIVQIIEQVSEELEDPVELVFKSLYDIIFHGRQIADHVRGAIDNYEKKDWFGFGEDLGEVVARLLESPPTPPTPIIKSLVSFYLR